MVFINKLEELIKQFKDCSRSEIGTALLAYEEYLCKGLDVSNDDLKRLQEVFKYYDDNYSDDFPSLTNEALQYPKNIIINMFNDIEKDDYKFSFQVGSVNDNSTTIDVSMYNSHSGNIERDFEYVYNNKALGINADNQLGLAFMACQETKKQLENKNVEELLETYKI